MNGPLYVKYEENSISLGVVGRVGRVLEQKLLADFLSVALALIFFFFFGLEQNLEVRISFLPCNSLYNRIELAIYVGKGVCVCVCVYVYKYMCFIVK